MPFPTASGDNGPTFHPTELLFDPRRGMSMRQRITCAVLNESGELNLLSLLRQAQALGASGSMVFSGAQPELKYELPGVPSNLVGLIEELFFDDWEMAIDDLTNTVFDANCSLGASLNYNDRMFFQRYAKLGSGTEGQEVETTLNDDLAAGLFTAPSPADGGTSDSKFQFPAYSPLNAQLFLMIDKDQTEFLAPLPVLHHTSCCSPGMFYNVTRGNEMCIYSTAQLLTEVGSGWTCNLPGAIYSQISSFPMLAAPDPETSFFTWGWLKMRQTRKTQTNFSIEVHQEYKLNLWPHIYYNLR